MLKVQWPAVIASWAYSATSLISACPRNENRPLVALAQRSLDDGLGLLRSKQPSRGMKGAVASGLLAVFGSNPASAQSPGSLIVGSPAPTNVPAAFWVMHGSLAAGSVSPRLKLSVRRVC